MSRLDLNQVLKLVSTLEDLADKVENNPHLGKQVSWHVSRAAEEIYDLGWEESFEQDWSYQYEDAYEYERRKREKKEQEDAN